MNKEDYHIKPLMQILLGIGLFAIYYLMSEPIQTIEKHKGKSLHIPSDELFINFMRWISLLGPIFLSIIGVAQIAKRIFSRNGSIK